MRKTLAITAATGAILFGGAGVANATAPAVQPPAATTTTVAQTGDNNTTTHSDKTGLWGLLGLAGLAGLAGLRRRNDAHAATGTTAPRAHG
jgi:MYXO-CTERM domain-containing protein